jgi:hypothetical protein
MPRRLQWFHHAARHIGMAHDFTGNTRNLQRALMLGRTETRNSKPAPTPAKQRDEALKETQPDKGEGGVP